MRSAVALRGVVLVVGRNPGHAHLHENRPARAQAWRDCEQMIEAAIATVGEDLTRRLQYSDTDATEILGNALAYYLDERFSITTRRMLGFLE